ILWRTFADFSRAGSRKEWLIREVLPSSGFGLVAGMPNAGKSWFNGEVAWAVSTGTRFLGKYEVPRPARVLYVDQDTTQDLLEERLRALANGRDPGEFLRVVAQAGFALNRHESQKRLEALCEDYRPELVILDTMASMVQGFAENRADHIQVFVEPIKRLA